MMTKAELDYSRSLMAETNSILAGLDSTKRCACPPMGLPPLPFNSQGIGTPRWQLQILKLYAKHGVRLATR
jgi:hypothetical protein